MNFSYHGTKLVGRTDDYNSTAYNERAVEMSVVEHWLDGVDGEGLELGNVCAHYGIGGHRVVDLFEGPERRDVFDVSGSYDWVLSVSTVEHVGWDAAPRDSGAALRAIRHLWSLVREGGQMLVTVPAGYHKHLDAALAEGIGESRAATFARHGSGWRQSKSPVFKPYGASTPWAESVWIGEWL